MKKLKNTRISHVETKDYLPLLFLIGILPIITIAHTCANSYGDYPWSISGDILDFFLWGKSIVLYCITLLMVGIFIYNVKKKKWFPSMNNQLYWIITYAGLALLSALFSNYKQVSFTGATEQFESVFVLISYVVICIFSYYLIDASSQTAVIVERWWKNFFLICLMPTLFLCTSQFFHMDLFQFLLANTSVNFNFTAGTVYGSFYNPNFVGSYVVLLFPVVLLLLLGMKSITTRILCVLSLIMLTFALLGSRSASGFLILGIVCLIFLITQIHNWKTAGIAGIVIVVGIIGFYLANATHDHYYTQKISLSMHPEANEPAIQSIETNDEDLQIIYKGNLLKIRFQYDDTVADPYIFTILDQKDQMVSEETDSSDGSIHLTDERFQTIQICPVSISDMNNMLAFYVTIDDKNWLFTNQTDGTYYYINPFGNLDKIDNAPMALFTKNSGFASGRGFLWGKTIPLLKKYILLGSGPDTYAYVYPQSDYVGKYNNGYEGTYVTRPHNMYLQIWTQTGLLSLICFLVFYGIYMIQSFRIYRPKQKTTYEWYVGYGIFLGTLGYMLIGFFNDSTITVAPVFWCLLGIGIAINCKIKPTNKTV